MPSIHSQQVAPQPDPSSSTTIPLLSLSPTDLSDKVTYQNTNPFASAPVISPANPFFSLLQQNPFFQEVHSVTPLTPALPFLCSTTIYQPEMPASKPNTTPPLHLVEAGNAKGTQVNRSSHNLTNAYRRTDASDDSDKCTQWDDFIGDGLKLNSKTIPSSYPIELTNPRPTCVDGDLIVSNEANALGSLCNTTPACTLIADALPHFEAEVKFMHCSTQNTDINNLFDQNASELDSSLSLNSSTEFSEINALTCPYPIISNGTLNKDKVCSVSVCQINITPNAMPVMSVSPESSALNSETLDYLDLDKNSDHEKVKCISSKRQRDDDIKSSLEMKTSLPYYNFDILEASSILTSESRGYNVPESKPPPKGQRHFKSDDGIGTGHGDVELKESAIKERTCLDVHPATYPLDLSVPSGPSDFMLQERLIEKDAADNPGCRSLDRNVASFVGEDFAIKNLKVLMDSSSMHSSNISFKEEKASDSPPNPSKANFKIEHLSETLSGICEAETPNSSRQTPSSAVSPGYMLSHSLYKSVDSEQYLTCMSQHSSLTISHLSPVANLQGDIFQEAKPKSGSSPEILPTNYHSRRTISVQDLAEISQEALTKIGGISQYDPLVSLQNTLEKCDIIEEAITSTVTNESIQKYDPPMDTLIPNTFEMMTTRVEEELLMLAPNICMDNKICSSEPHQSHRVQCDGALEGLEIITDFCQSTDNICVSDFVSEPTPSITQDLVTTDLLLENVIVAQHAATHSVGTSPVTHPVPREPWHMALCPYSIKASQISKNTQATTTAASIPQGKHLESTIHWSTFQPPLPEPSTLDRLTSGHDLLMNSPLSLLDLSPLASSTPHVAAGLPLSPFPMPSAPAKLLPHTALAASTLPSICAASHDPFPQEERQVACHLSR